MRENFRLMSSLATYTRLNPKSRIDKLINFNNRLRNKPNIVKEFTEWNLQLDNKLLEVPGRVLGPEQLRFGGDAYIQCLKGDWSKEMQKKKCLIAQPLRDWILIITERDRHALQVLSNFYLQYIFTFTLYIYYLYYYVFVCPSVSLVFYMHICIYVYRKLFSEKLL